MNKLELGTLALGGGSNKLHLPWTGTMPAITPSYDVNLIVNGEFTADTGTWTPNNATLTKRDSSVTPGAASGGVDVGCLEVNKTGASAGARQPVTIDNGAYYHFDGLLYAPSANTGILVATNRIGTSAGGLQYGSDAVTAEDVWQDLPITFLSTGTTANISCYANTGTNGDLAYFDRVRLRKLIVQQAMQLIRTSVSDVTGQVAVSGMTALTRAGIVLNVDNPSNPQNWVAGLLDRNNAILLKCVAGSITNVIVATAITYGAAKVLKLINNAGTFQLFYDGIQIGTDQAIAGMTGTYHGLLSSLATNTFGPLTLQ